MREIKVKCVFISEDVDEELGVQYMKTQGSVVNTIIREACRPTTTPPIHFGLETIKEACHYGNLTCLQYFGISVPFLIEILSRCPVLQELHVQTLKSTTDKLTLPNCISLTDLRVYGDVRILQSIISVSPNLQKFSFQGNLNDVTLTEIAEKCRKLRFLGLLNTSRSKPAIVSLTSLCTEIVNLDLSYTTVSDEVIESVAVNLKHLRRLNLQNCCRLTNAALHSLATHRASTLQMLWLCNYSHVTSANNITSDAIIALKSAVPTLHVYGQLALSSHKSVTMTLSDCEVYTVLIIGGSVRNVLPVASQCPNLAIVYILDDNFTNAIETNVAAMAEIARCCPRLHTIIVRKEDLHAMKKAVATIARCITVTSCCACLNANLQDFSV